MRWQRTWAIGGFGLIAVGIGASIAHACTFVYGAYAFVLGPALLFSSVLPASHATQTIAIKLIVPTALVILGSFHGVHLETASIRVNTIHAYAVAVLSAHALYIMYALRYARIDRPPSPGGHATNALIVATDVYRNAMMCYVPVGIVWGFAIRDDDVPCVRPHPWWLRLISHGGLSIVAMAVAVLLRPWWHDAAHAFIARHSEGAFIAGSISDAMITCDDERRSWQTIEKRMRDARRTLRGVDMARLTSTHLSQLGFSADAYALSVPAKVGTIDAFISHSWHDEPKEKWRLLQAWRGAFKRRHLREPIVWIDRCCVDQSAVHFKDLINYLPIYLAGCRTLVVLNGPTYTQRLWCVIELYVFHELRLPDSQVEILEFEPVVCVPVAQPRGRRASQPLTPSRRFDVLKASCTYTHDTTRLMRVIAANCHVDSFNAWVHVLLVERLLVDRPRA